MENVLPPKGCYWELVPETNSTTLRLMKRRLVRKNKVLAQIWMNTTDIENVERAARATLDTLKEMGEI